VDLHRIADDLKQLEQRLERQAAPVRARLEWLGTAGLYAMAAEELRIAEASSDPQAAALHRGAAVAAEALADHLL
jgi:hypothetical protein